MLIHQSELISCLWAMAIRMAIYQSKGRHRLKMPNLQFTPKPCYVRTLDVWGKSAKFDVILPYSQLSGSALVGRQPLERNVSGFNDLRLRFSFNFYGAPALSPQEFAKYQQDVIVGASVQVSAPTGQYDEDKLVNLGNNRWFVKPNVGASKAWGPFALELSTGFFFFSKNDDYFGGKRLSKIRFLLRSCTPRTTLRMAFGLQ